MSKQDIYKYIKTVNNTRTRNNRLLVSLSVLSSIVILIATLGLMLYISSGQVIPSFIVAAIGSIYFFKKFKPQKSGDISESDLLSHLEINHDILLSKKVKNEHNLKEILEKEKVQVLRKERVRIRKPALHLLLSLIFLGIIGPISKSELISTIERVKRIANALTLESVITIKEGSVTEVSKNSLYIDSSKTHEIKLLPKNLIEVKITLPFSDAAPALQLKKFSLSDKTKEEDYQRFQMNPVREPDTGKPVDKYFSITFSAEHSMNVYIPEFSSDPILSIEIEKLPVPEVEIAVATQNPKDPWPDENPLPIRVEVEAKNPLRSVKFLITTSGRTREELVANILKQDQTSYVATYDLFLEPYVDQDLSKVEIVAQATDRAIPKPLTGYSEPISINTASAYGRYQRALQALKDVKTSLDEAKSTDNYEIDPKAMKAMNKAIAGSEDTPFFDLIDRMTIKEFSSNLKRLQRTPKAQSIVGLSLNLDEFLFEHEMIDDRERDRDFFVAARSLSRILEKPKSKRQIDITYATDKTKYYLNQRRARWKLRLERIPEDLKPKMADSVMKKKPFVSAMDKINKEATKVEQPSEKAMLTLAGIVPQYRTWIESLEEAEDKAQERREKKRQQSLKKQENMIKKLQKQQAKVSKDLDKASSQSKDQLQKKWPNTKSLEEDTQYKTQQMVGQMMMQAPEAAERIEAAAKAMQNTITSGNQGDYIRAESMADLAGRLLRQAQSKARQKRQQSKSGRQRQRKRASGDNYFGKAIMGGDVVIQRTYEVDQKYREAILDEVRSYDASPENKRLLKKYLRETVR